MPGTDSGTDSDGTYIYQLLNWVPSKKENDGDSELDDSKVCDDSNSNVRPRTASYHHPLLYTHTHTHTLSLSLSLSNGALVERQNAVAKKRRRHQNVEMDELGELLPYRRNDGKSLDKLAVLRLTNSLFKLQSFMSRCKYKQSL